MPIAADVPSPALPAEPPAAPAEQPADKPAAKLIPESAKSWRTRIYNYIRNCGANGATCEQIELALKLSHQTCSARCAELRNHPVHGGRIKIKTADGRKVKRPTLSGRRAYVYVINEQLSELPLP